MLIPHIVLLDWEVCMCVCVGGRGLAHEEIFVYTAATWGLDEATLCSPLQPGSVTSSTKTKQYKVVLVTVLKTPLTSPDCVIHMLWCVTYTHVVGSCVPPLGHHTWFGISCDWQLSVHREKRRNVNLSLISAGLMSCHHPIMLYTHSFVYVHI